jgi:hypothetical protein
MALPPEPLDTVLVDAKIVLIGVVAAVTQTGPTPPQREGKKGERDVGNKAPWQRVQLTVERALRGDVAVGATVEALKPEGAYVVDAGTRGAFLLGAPDDGAAPILGRYGPDTWREDVVTGAFARS